MERELPKPRQDSRVRVRARRGGACPFSSCPGRERERDWPASQHGAFRCLECERCWFVHAGGEDGSTEDPHHQWITRGASCVGETRYYRRTSYMTHGELCDSEVVSATT